MFRTRTSIQGTEFIQLQHQCVVDLYNIRTIFIHLLTELYDLPTAADDFVCMTNIDPGRMVNKLKCLSNSTLI